MQTPLLLWKKNILSCKLQIDGPFGFDESGALMQMPHPQGESVEFLKDPLYSGTLKGNEGPVSMSRSKKIIILLTVNIVIISTLLLAAEGYLRYTNRFEGMNGGWLTADPVLGYRPADHLEGVFSEWGVRTPPFSTPKPSGTFRILVIGDSVAWPKNGFVSMLGDALGSGFEVINAAVPGYTIHQERLMMERLLPVDPDLVILQYCLNDHHKFLHELSGNGRWLFTAEARAALNPSDNSLISSLTRKSRLMQAIRLRLLNSRKANNSWAKRPDVGSAWSEAGWSYYRDELKLIETKLGEIPLVVVAVPYKPQLTSSEPDALFPQEHLSELCQQTNTALLDLTPDFQLRDDPLYNDQLHLNKEGHALVAEKLKSYLQSNALISP